MCLWLIDIFCHNTNYQSNLVRKLRLISNYRYYGLLQCNEPCNLNEINAAPTDIYLQKYIKNSIVDISNRLATMQLNKLNTNCILFYRNIFKGVSTRCVCTIQMFLALMKKVHCSSEKQYLSAKGNFTIILILKYLRASVILAIKSK